MPNAPVNGTSVAAMMRRGLSLMESRLILAAPAKGPGNRWGEEPARR